MTDPIHSTSDATAYAESLNARQIGILMTGKSDSTGRGYTLGPAVTRKALQRRGLLDDAMCWTDLGREVVEIIEPGAAGRKPTTAEEAPMTDTAATFDCAACGRPANTNGHIDPPTHVNGIHVPIEPTTLTVLVKVGDVIDVPANTAASTHSNRRRIRVERVSDWGATGIRVRADGQPVSGRSTHVVEDAEPWRVVALCSISRRGLIIFADGQPTAEGDDFRAAELRHAIVTYDSAIPAARELDQHDRVAEITRKREALIPELCAIVRRKLDRLDVAAKATPSAIVGINEDREILIGELARHGTVRYPAGTPEHDAYRAELTTELAKFAGREAPYDVEPEPRPGAARLVGLEAGDVPAVVEHLTPSFDATSAVAELPEMFAAIRGEQRDPAGRVAIDSLAELVDRVIPGFAATARLAWLNAEGIADPDDSRCTVCGVVLPGIGEHDATRHEAARAAERAGRDRPEPFADSTTRFVTLPAGALGDFDHSPGAANMLPNIECDDPKHCPLLDGDGEPVNVPECFSGDLGAARLFYAGRVKVECGHYTSKSEARAGFKTCERC